MNTRIKLAVTVAALGLICAWTVQADDSKRSAGEHADKEMAPAAAVAKGVDDVKGGTNTPTPDNASEPAATTLSFDLEVHKGMTKKSFRIKERGTLNIKNKSADKNLRIESDDEPPPFDVKGYPTPQSGFTVGPNSKLSVTIAAAYVDGMRFTYKSQIEGSLPDDPIVIIEKP